MATEDITLRVKIDELEAELKKIPGITEREMKGMLAAVSKSYKAQTKEAEDSAKAQARAIEKATREAEQAAEKQLGALERVADKFTGGLAGDMKDLAEAGLGPLGAAGTLAAVGVGAAVAAVVALGAASIAAAAGVVEITRAADDAIAALDELGMAELVSPESRQAVEDANLALDALGVVVDQLVIALATDFAPTVVWAAEKLFELGLTGLKTVEDFSKTGDVIESFVLFLATGFVKGLAAPITGLAKLGEAISWVAGMVGQSTPTIDAAVAGYDAWAESAAKSITGLDGLDDAVSSGAQSFTDFGAVMARLRDARAKDAEAANAQKAATDAANKATRDAAQAAREAAKEQRENAEALRKVEAAADAVANATETLNGIRDQSMDRFLSDQERLAKNYQDELARIDAVVERVAEHSLTLEQVAQVEAAASEARLAATSEYIAKLDEIAVKESENQEARVAAVEQTAESWAAYWEREAEEGQEWLDDRIKAIAAVAGAVQDLGAYFEELHRKRLDETMTEREAEIERIKTLRGEERAAAVEKLKQLTAQANEQRKQVNKAFQAQKAAQIAMALIDGARSALSLIPAFAFLGPAAPAAAAGVAAAATAVQIAQIAAQKPKFHTGLDPSETPAIITRGEGIANQRAMTSPVFREQLRAANAGEQAESGHGTVIMLNDRVLATLDRRTARVTGRVQSGRRASRVGTSTHYDR